MTLSFLTSWLLAYKYWALFPIVVIEGPIITVVAGFLISLGIFNPLVAYIVIVVGDTVGDALMYALGRWGGMPFIRRWGKYFAIKEAHVKHLEEVLKGKEGRVFALGKLAHGVGGALLVAAGVIEMPFWKFIWWNVLGTLPKSLGLMLIGYYFAHAITKINSVLDVVASGTIILGIVLVYVWIYRYNKKHNIQ
jgi:membrane protein DedA with SNARE-associated domain